MSAAVARRAISARVKGLGPYLSNTENSRALFRAERDLGTRLIPLFVHKGGR